MQRGIGARPSGRLTLWLIVALMVAGGLISASRGTTAVTTPATGAPTCSAATYVVKSGDSWSVIASRSAVSMSSLLAANAATVATNLYPGQTLCLPASAVVPTTTPTNSTAPSSTTPTSGPKPTAVPLSFFPVQGPCGFTDSWGAPRSNGRRHQGVDILAKTGLYVYAVRDGVLTKKYVDTPGGLSGNGWRLTATDGTYFFYAHFSAFPAGLAVGSVVKAGQIIGFIGMTGSAGAPHLHFEVHPGGGEPINPTPTVRAVDGCKTSVVPPQPGGVIPGPAPSGGGTTTTTQPSSGSTTAPTTTKPPTNTAPTTTKPPATTAPPTTQPGSNPGSIVPTANGTLWRFVAPALALDTGGNRLTAGTAKTVSIANLAGVPTGTPGVLLRIAARNISGNGFLIVHPCDAPQPQAVTISLTPGRLNAATAMVSSLSSRFCVTSSVATDVRIDVVAFVAVDGVGVQPVIAKRAVDTRSNTRLAANGTRGLSLRTLGVPSGSVAATVTVTLLNPASAGSLGIGPCGGTPWIVPFQLAPVQSFTAVVRTNDAGICMSSTVAADAIADVTGVWGGPKPLLPVAPRRVFDSRSGAAVGGAPITVTIPGLAANVTQAQLTITVVGGSTGAAVFAWPCNQPRPSASVATAPAKIVASLSATVGVSNGTLCLASTGSVHIIIDVTGAG